MGGPAFHEFASELFLWPDKLQHEGSPLTRDRPYSLLPGGETGQYYLPGGYLIAEHPDRGVVVWPRAYMTLMPPQQAIAKHSAAGTAAGSFTTPPRLEVFAENGRLPYITKQMLTMILGTLEPGVSPQIRLYR